MVTDNIFPDSVSFDKRYRYTCNAVRAFDIDVNADLNNSPNRLIGYEEYLDIFRSMIPIVTYDESGEVNGWEDFAEIFPAAFPDSRKTSAAFLLAGKTGCGRHTADKTFMSVVYETLRSAFFSQMDPSSPLGFLSEPDFEEFLRFYVLDCGSFAAQPERTLLKTLDAVFDKLYALAVSEPSVIFYFSLGNVTAMLENTKSARRFVSRLNSLTGDARAHCLVTCIFDGDAAALSDALTQPFYTLEFAPPAYRYRMEYFQFLSERYPNIRAELSDAELAKRTDGFTFSMIKQLAAYIMMFVKSQVLTNHLDMENYLRYATISEEEVLVIPKHRIERYLSMVQHAHYVAPAVTQPVVYANAPQAAVAAEPFAQQPFAAVQRDQDGDLSTEQMVKKTINTINTPSQIFQTRDSLLKPMGYIPEKQEKEQNKGNGNSVQEN